MAAEQETIQEKGNNLDAVFWGGSLLWAGAVFGLEYFSNLPQVGAANAWSWIFLGMGVYSLLLNTIRNGHGASSCDHNDQGIIIVLL